MIRIYIIIVSVFFGCLFIRDRSNQTERETNYNDMRIQAELHRAKHEARMQQLNAQHVAYTARIQAEAEERARKRHKERVATEARLRLVEQLRALDAKQGK